jgi:hypothetical protein
MAIRYRVALSSEHLDHPVPTESSPSVWVYEVEAEGDDSAFDRAHDMWREQMGIRVGDGVPKFAIATRI